MPKPREGFARHLADICTAQRIEKRLSHTQLAHMCCFEVSQLRDFEQGENSLDLEQIEQLLNTLNVQYNFSEISHSADDDLRRTRESAQKKALRELSKSDDVINGYLQRAVQLITRTASEVLSAEFTGVWLLNDERDHLDCIDEYVLSEDLHEPEYEYSADEFPGWFAEFEGRRSLVHDTVTEDNFDAHEEFEEERDRWNIKSSIESTIIENGEIIGVITTEDIVERHWQLDEISFHNQIADLIMLTVRNRNYRKLQESLDKKKQQIQCHQQAILALMHNEAISEGFLQEACDEITQTIAAKVKVDSVSVWLMSEDQDMMRCASTYLLAKQQHDEGVSRYSYPCSKYPKFIQALETERVIFTESVYADERYSEFVDDVLAPDGIVSSSDASVYVYGKLAGALCLEYYKPHTWTDEEENFLADISNQLTLAILNHERKKSEHQLQMLSRAVENSSSAVFIAQSDKRINYCNAQLSQLLEKPISNIQGCAIHDLPFSDESLETSCALVNAVNNQEHWRGEIELDKGDGNRLWVLFSITPVVNEGRGSIEYVGVCEDISTLKLAHQEMEQLAFYDPLTGLVNRRLFKERLKQHISFAKRHETKAAILYLDLDRFKVVNDTLGHDMGDQLLMTIAERLRLTVREQDTVARLGGDEFSVLVPDAKTVTDVEVLAKKIIAVIGEPIEVNEQKLSTTTSIGISLYPEHGEDPSELLKQADMAMYHAKSEGRNNYQLYNERINMFSADYLDMEHDLRQALKNKEFVLHYQPIVDATTGQVHKLEALIRWQHPTKGMQSPLTFIPVAEELGLIEDIGDWVLAQACMDLKEVHKFNPQVQMAINLTAGEFSNPELVKKVSETLRKTGLAGEHLTLEITESMLISHLDRAINTLKGLKKLGVAIAIDDFGTGYSSLSYLKRLPLDFIKVDRSFVKDIPDDVNDMEITAAVISMAHKLHLQVVAEGVETNDQLKFLEDNQCNYYQGFLFAKPCAFDDLVSVFDTIDSENPSVELS